MILINKILTNQKNLTISKILKNFQISKLKNLNSSKFQKKKINSFNWMKSTL